MNQLTQGEKMNQLTQEEILGFETVLLKRLINKNTDLRVNYSEKTDEFSFHIGSINLLSPNKNLPNYKDPEPGGYGSNCILLSKSEYFPYRVFDTFKNSTMLLHISAYADEHYRQQNDIILYNKDIIKLIHDLGDYFCASLIKLVDIPASKVTEIVISNKEPLKII